MIAAEARSNTAHPVGAIEIHINRVAWRIVAGWRAVLVVLGGLAIVAAPRSGRLTAACLVAILIPWSGCYVRLLWLQPPIWLVWADLVFVVVACLSQPSTVPDASADNAQGWVLALASLTAIACQWHTRIPAGAASALVISAAFVLGAHWTAPGRWGGLAIGVWIPVQAVLSRQLRELLLRGARSADLRRGQAAAARLESAVAAAARADQRAYAALLHDTAATTLLMVGMGEVDADRRWLRDQARRDLVTLDDTPDTDLDAENLVPCVSKVLDTSPALVNLSAPAAIPVPRRVGTVLCGAVREALNNVVRHSGVAAAQVRLSSAGDRVVVEVVDRGQGFDPASVPPERRGIAASIVERLSTIEGSATIDSQPGQGTTVRLEWRRARRH